MKMIAALALATALPTVLLAQPASHAVAASEPDAGAVNAARDLLSVMFPPAERQRLFGTMLNAMTKNVVAGVKSVVSETHGCVCDAMIDKFMAVVMTDETDDLKVSMPGLFEAYARAYARNFSASDLADILIFAKTTTGLKFFQRSQFLLSDPDVAKWQTQQTAQSVRRLAPRIEALKAELVAANTKGGKP